MPSFGLWDRISFIGHCGLSLNYLPRVFTPEAKPPAPLFWARVGTFPKKPSHPASHPIPCYRWGAQGPGRLCGLSKVTRLVSGRDRNVSRRTSNHYPMLSPWQPHKLMANGLLMAGAIYSYVPPSSAYAQSHWCKHTGGWTHLVILGQVLERSAGPDLLRQLLTVWAGRGGRGHRGCCLTPVSPVLSPGWLVVSGIIPGVSNKTMFLL